MLRPTHLLVSFAQTCIIRSSEVVRPLRSLSNTSYSKGNENLIWILLLENLISPNTLSCPNFSMLFCTVLQKMCIFKELMLLQVNEQRHFFLYIAYQHVSWNYIFSCLNIGTRKDKWVRLHIQESINVSYGFAIVWMLNDYPKHTYPFGKALVNRMLLLGGDVY